MRVDPFILTMQQVKETSMPSAAHLFPPSCSTMFSLLPTISTAFSRYHLGSRVRVHLGQKKSAKFHPSHTTIYCHCLTSAMIQAPFYQAQGARHILTHLSLPTSHSNIHESPSIGDSLLCTSFGSVIVLDYGTGGEAKHGEGERAFSVVMKSLVVDTTK